MKKQLLLLVIFFITINAFAKDNNNRHSFSLGYGLGTYYSFDKKAAFYVPNYLYSDYLSVINEKGQYFLRFGMKQNKRINLYLTWGLVQYSGTLNNTSYQTWESQSIIFLQEASYILKKQGKLSVYSLEGAGLSYKMMQSKKIGPFLTMDTKSSPFAWQVSPLCIRYGNKFAFYAEAGYGFKGILNAGLSLSY